jgi:hypothetical protein
MESWNGPTLVREMLRGLTLLWFAIGEWAFQGIDTWYAGRDQYDINREGVDIFQSCGAFLQTWSTPLTSTTRCTVPHEYRLGYPYPGVSGGANTRWQVGKMWIIKRERCDEELVAADVGGEGKKEHWGRPTWQLFGLMRTDPKSRAYFPFFCSLLLPYSLRSQSYKSYMSLFKISLAWMPDHLWDFSGHKSVSWVRFTRDSI